MFLSRFKSQVIKTLYSFRPIERAVKLENWPSTYTSEVLICLVFAKIFHHPLLRPLVVKSDKIYGPELFSFYMHSFKFA